MEIDFNLVNEFKETIEKNPQNLNLELANFISQNSNSQTSFTTDYLLEILLPIIIPLTNNNNYSWLNHYNFNNNLLSIIIANLDKFNFTHNTNLIEAVLIIDFLRN